MKIKRMPLMTVALTLLILLFSNIENAQNAPIDSSRQKSTAVVTGAMKSDESSDYRHLQSDEFLVDTAYLQDEGEFLHKLEFSLSKRGKWLGEFTEEITLGNEKHNVIFSLPARFAGNDAEKSRGLGDAQIEYFLGSTAAIPHALLFRRE